MNSPVYLLSLVAEVPPPVSGRFQSFMYAVERHKEFVDLSIKAAAIALTLLGALGVAVSYFLDRRKERRKTELDLRREAYFDLFTAIPLQLAALGKFSADSESVEVSRPAEGYKARHRRHLLASHDALQCIIKRNAIYHEGIIQITSLKKTARQFQAVMDAGDERMTERVVNSWDDFRTRFRQLMTDLSINYRDLLVFARREIELSGEMAPILEALKRNQEAALSAWS
jgi:hypothetical protein